MKKNSVSKNIFMNLQEACNKLPPPAIIFLFLFFVVAFLSALLALLHISFVNPSTGELMAVKSFFTPTGLYWYLDTMISNFVNFAPLGPVLVMTVAVGFCERTGLLEVLMKVNMRNIPGFIVPYAVAFISVMGNIASDSAIIIIPPLAGLLYLSSGRHPSAGMMTSYLATQSGFCANLIVSGSDALITSVSQKTIDDYLGAGVLQLDVTCNWYFMAASTLLCTLIIGFCSTKIIEPALGSYTVSPRLRKREAAEAGPLEIKAMKWAGVSLAVFIIAVICGSVWGPLGIIVGQEDIQARGFIGSYLLKNILPILVFFFVIPGVVYGRVSKKLTGPKEVVGLMTKTVETMGSYIVFCFFAAQFQALFNWTGISTLLAVTGANFLKVMHLDGAPLFICFIVVSSILNIFISSGSAKWALMAPVFIPMFMMSGSYHPAFIQMLYRVGDSASNGFTPLSPYLWITLKSANDVFDPDLKIGTMVVNLLKVCIVLLIAWIILVVIWHFAGLPVGPGYGTYLQI